MARDHGKDVIAVLKDDRRDLMGDAMGLFQTIQPAVSRKGKKHRQTWDMEGFMSWEGFGRQVRVVRCLETQMVTRQLHVIRARLKRREIFEQKYKMYKDKSHRIADRIVSFHRPWVRPIKRGKTGKDVEFGAKAVMSHVDGSWQ